MRKLVLVIALLVLTGCGPYTISLTDVDVNTEALALMELKYGEKFEYSTPYGNSMSGTREFLATCESVPDKLIHVQIQNYRTEDPVYNDNFATVRYFDTTSYFFKELAAGYFGDARIHTYFMHQGLTSTLDPSPTFDE